MEDIDISELYSMLLPSNWFSFDPSKPISQRRGGNSEK
jgi:hypothetical protein